MSLVNKLEWVRSSFCESNACVEVADDGKIIRVRPSWEHKLETRFTRDEWATFIDGVKNGDFDFD